MRHPSLALALLTVPCACSPESGAAPAPVPASAAPSPESQGRAELEAFARGAAVFLAGAGDISSCAEDGDEATAGQLDRLLAVQPGLTVYTLGDNAYGSGSAAEYRDCFAPTWGRFRDRTIPTIGNHDARTDRGRPYHEFYGERAGTYGQSWKAHTVGAWKIVVLNSNCDQVDCTAAGEQGRFLAAELDAHEGTAAERGAKKACTALMWHHPPFSSGPHGDAASMAELWRMAVEHDVELVLTGHDHIYERFAPMGADGAPSAAGVRSVVVGTGGKEAYPLEAAHAGSEFRMTGVPGVLALSLTPEGYQARFALVTGRIADRFDGTCR